MDFDVEEKLRQIMKIVLDLPEEADVTKIRRINEKRWDSLAHTSLIAAIESEFGIQFGVQDIELCGSYASTLAVIGEKSS